MKDQDIGTSLQDRVNAALESATPLRICGGGTKDFYGREPVGEAIDISAHRGIVNYEPTELVVTARAGTPLREIEEVLATQQQMLAFEPPHFGESATLGGTIACNLSGPRRAYSGAARDFVLGTKILNGRGEILSFGGEVMKNVAGYDVSRLMTGALGTLGILFEVSLKVLPKPDAEMTLMRETGASDALGDMHDWARRPYPISATCFDGGALYLRLSGEARAIELASQRIGGERLTDGDGFWQRLREHRHGFFQTNKGLWRLSITSDTPPMPISGKWLFEWGGAQRWLVSDAPASAIREAAAGANGHAMRFRDSDRDNVFHPLAGGLMSIHRRLKRAFDPQGILNPGRMYREL